MLKQRKFSNIPSFKHSTQQQHNKDKAQPATTMRPADELKATDSDTMSTHFWYKQFFLIFLCKETCSALMFQQLSLLWFAASKDTHVTAAAKKIGTGKNSKNADQLFVNIKLLLLLTTCTHIQYVRGCVCVLLK